MPSDEQLVARIRKVLARRKGIEEQRMFGGIAFLWRRQMVVGVLEDRIVVRLGEALATAALAERHVSPMDFTGRVIKSMVYVDGPGVTDQADLERWVRLALDFVRTLPPKEER